MFELRVFPQWKHGLISNPESKSVGAFASHSPENASTEEFPYHSLQEGACMFITI